MLADCKEKFGIVGKTQMQGTVYFVPNTHDRYEEIIATFKKGCVQYAGELPAKESISYENELGEKFLHSYEYSWDFSTDTKFFGGVKEIIDYCELKTSMDSFVNTPVYGDLKNYLFP